MLVLINQDYDDKPPICHYKNVSMFCSKVLYRRHRKVCRLRDFLPVRLCDYTEHTEYTEYTEYIPW